MLESADMTTPIETYRRVVGEQPTCDAPFFADALSRYRAGDESAARLISGSCLRFALAIAEERTKAVPALALLDAIQEANAGLMEAITTFPGDDLHDFMEHARLRIHQRIDALP
jgi:DNA-directed RNA polymerase sigma subunit (sigma70/sigma32)